MKEELRIASVGTSAIMRMIQEGIRLTPGLTVRVIYSRDADRGRSFAEEMGVDEWCDDYEKVLARPDIDVVYIASPNSFHERQAIQALQSGKHVIVEKPAAVRKEGAQAMTAAAKANGAYVFEAITTLFMPNYLAWKEFLGTLGPVKNAKLCFGKYSSKYEAYLRGENPNIFNPQMETGALNDMGIYCVHVAVDLFGKPQDVRYEPKLGPNGIDLAGILTLTYPGFVCRIETDKSRDLPCGCYLEAERGYVRQEGMLNNFENCSGERDGQTFDLNRQEEGNRMIYELAAFRDAIVSKDEAFFERMSAQSETAAWILQQAHQHS